MANDTNAFLAADLADVAVERLRKQQINAAARATATTEVPLPEYPEVRNA